MPNVFAAMIVKTCVETLNGKRNVSGERLSLALCRSAETSESLKEDKVTVGHTRT